MTVGDGSWCRSLLACLCPMNVFGRTIDGFRRTMKVFGRPIDAFGRPIDVYFGDVRS